MTDYDHMATLGRLLLDKPSRELCAAINRFAAMSRFNFPTCVVNGAAKEIKAISPHCQQYRRNQINSSIRHGPLAYLLPAMQYYVRWYDAC